MTPLLPAPVHDDDRYVVVSADGHCGASIGAYRDYLERRWHAEFDEWAGTYVDPWAQLAATPHGTKAGSASGALECNWDTSLRQQQIEADGVVGEVLFPNTVPPFFPSASLRAKTPHTRGEYERRSAGLRAHNRWLVDFCAELPGRRAGVAQILLNDVDDAIREVRWARAAGLTGGVLVPSVDIGSPVAQLHSPDYEPLWQVCSDLDVTITHHSGHGSADTGVGSVGTALHMVEVRLWSHRIMWLLMFAGVFARHPRLRLVLTEQGASWVPGTLSTLDASYRRMTVEGSAEASLGTADAIASMPHTPSRYFATNCFLGASFLHSSEVDMRHEIGLDRLMWGADYPHNEGTYPYTREALRAAFSSVTPAEVQTIVGETAVRVYGLDPDALVRAARVYGPTVSEIAQPFGGVPAGSTCSVFEPAVTRVW